MEITYTWKVKNLNRELIDGYVFSADWMFFASVEDHTRSISGSTKFDRGDDMIPYEELTEDLIIEWIRYQVGNQHIDSMKRALSSEIMKMYAPESDSGTPW